MAEKKKKKNGKNPLNATIYLFELERLVYSRLKRVARVLRDPHGDSLFVSLRLAANSVVTRGKVNER